MSGVGDVTRGALLRCMWFEISSGVPAPTVSRHVKKAGHEQHIGWHLSGHEGEEGSPKGCREVL